MKHVKIYTDGGCLGNPGKGGYAAVLIYGRHRKDISGGYALTTNNRMELMACIKGLEVLKYQCEVTITSDSKYVVDGISKGWAQNWRKNKWIRSNKLRAENSGLWERLLKLSQYHKVNFVWIKGHNGHYENEICGKLAIEAAGGDDLAIDDGYIYDTEKPPSISQLT
ncbi:MAG: ribonuclease HI [Desulfarculus sp.]|nr:ribonuclease HI [Desulfarculus sp.]